ncbi:MAG: HNH endonuclease, partial [Calditrichaeota bacterium]|nr:HNH endonuclease [Calditrichota bacterium]MCB0313341.1 HNH endonuclease [Calditrichota bacterium]
MMLTRTVLLLNQNYEPLAVCNVKKAIVLIFLDKAEIVEEGDGWIRSVNYRMRFPSVVRLTRYARAPQRRILLNR